MSKPLFTRILIANRGEIALRVMRTARRLGVECVAVYSDADKNAQHVKGADCAYRIGEAPALKSYLCMEKLLEVAQRSNSQAIHPGYGFLSENANFAEACHSAGVKFIGPSAEAIRAMGAKNRAKELMIAAGVPTLEGYNGRDQTDSRLLEEAVRLTFPVMIKPVCGGGGKGMRVAQSRDDFLPMLHSAQSESLKAFNDSVMIIERFVEQPRHVEVQVFGDQHGNYLHLWERDCSVQRRHQKIIEEAPAPGLSDEVRKRLGGNAVDAARAVNYEGAGTVEFLMDPATSAFYFMEMNTRLQVEHPVTETITGGTDLVEWQLKVAAGEKLPILDQADIPLVGHAIEARIYAEAMGEPPEMHFMPCAGKLEYLEFAAPELARVDSGVVEGDEVSVHYDPMIAKVIVSGANREEAIRTLDRALAATQIGGLPNNVDYVRACLAHPEFIDSSTLNTNFIERNKVELYERATRGTENAEVDMEQLVEGAVAELLLRTFNSEQHLSPFEQGDFFRLNANHRRIVQLNDSTWAEVEVLSGHYPPGEAVSHRCRIRQLTSSKLYHEQNEDERAKGDRVEVGVRDVKKFVSDSGNCKVVEFSVEVGQKEASAQQAKLWRARAVQLRDSILVFSPSGPPRKWPIPVDPYASWSPSQQHEDEHQIGAGGSLSEARAPISGVVEKVLVNAGDPVTKGQPLLTLNAMKMEFVIKAPCDTVVEGVECEAGEQVATSKVLMRFEQKKKSEEI